MLSWKTISLLVAAAVAMNGATAIEQGYGGGVKLPSATTATPADESVVQEAPTSVDASSAVDLSTDSNSATTSYPSKSDTALPSGSGRNDQYMGGAVHGSSTIDQSTSTPTPGKTGITSSTSGSSNLYTGSAVEGSSAIDQGSEAVSSSNGSGDVTVGSQEQQDSYGSSTSTSASGSAPCDEKYSLAGSSATGSDVAGSSTIDTSASGSEPCEGSLSLAGSSVDSGASQTTQGSATQSQGSGATTQTSEAGREATTPTSDTGSAATTPTSEAGSDTTTSTGSDSNPTQTEASAATESSGSATFPSTGTSCKLRLRRN